ncbi:MAG: dihydrofolate reductase family protein, partial [Bacteroidota bacterium]|nr:dihydrofolate reductase family protein [Bacteroidota bacterium]
IDKIYKDLYKRGINSLLVEGGRFTLNKIIEKGLWDEARVFESQIKFNRGIKGPNIEKTSFEKVGEDKLFKINNNA